MGEKLKPIQTNRAQLLARLASEAVFDVAIIGGGATGLGTALDAAARGFKVALFESQDFAKGTSSRATKLVHGGVRYLAQGNISLVREALHERKTLLENAPHLAQALPFVMPSYQWWETPFYGAGLKAYDLLAGKAGLGGTQYLNGQETLQLLPTAKQKDLRGGVKYWDGQFDDARLALALAQTAQQQGALMLNHCPAIGLIHEQGKVTGLQVQDRETGVQYAVQAKCVVNATGVWVDEVRRKDVNEKPCADIVTPSQGTHLVVSRRFMPSDHAVLIPKTRDGRVLFMVPWLGQLILGTTDSPRDHLDLEPTAFAQDIELILGEAGKYLQHAPSRADIQSIWVGLRPLVKPDDAQSTKSISREHTILVSASGLVSVTGGKWTTYRAMAEDVLDHAFAAKLLPSRPGGITTQLPLFGHMKNSAFDLRSPPGLLNYGSAADAVLQMPGAAHELSPEPQTLSLTEAMVRSAARHEYARSVEDVLARRSRALFLNARLAQQMAAPVAAILQSETGREPGLESFLQLCQQYQAIPAH